jgi:DNA polymerase III delta subunit
VNGNRDGVLKHEVQLFLGNDAALRRAALDQAVAAAIAEYDIDELDRDTFVLSDPASGAAGLSALRIAPLLSARRLVVFRSAERLLGSSKRMEVAALQEACQTVLPTTVLLLEAETLPKRTGDDSGLSWADASLAALVHGATEHSFMLPPPWQQAEAVQRIQALATTCGLRLPADAAADLGLRVGNDGDRLLAELRSIAAVIGGQPCTRAVLRKLVAGDKADLQRFVEALLAGRKTEALQLLAQISASSLSVAEVVQRLQPIVWRLALLRHTTTGDEKLVTELARISRGQLYYRRQEVKAFKTVATARALEAVSSMAEAASRGLPISKQALLVRFASAVLV